MTQRDRAVLVVDDEEDVMVILDVVLPSPTAEQQPGFPGARCSSMPHAPRNGPRPKWTRTQFRSERTCPFQSGSIDSGDGCVSR